MAPPESTNENVADNDEGVTSADLEETRENEGVEEPTEDDAKEQASIKPTLFSDEKGNLKFVNLVVKYPCLIFWTILLLCLLITFLLVATVTGNPFTEPGSDFDLDDVRSIQYDSFRLARDNVRNARDAAAEEGGRQVKTQSQGLDYTYWVFEGETSDGLFGSTESIAAMKEAFDLFMKDNEYEKYCQLTYSRDSSDPECSVPISPLIMYYASEWDNEMVAASIETLKIEENRELFNILGLCFGRGVYCDLIPDDISAADTLLALSLANNLTTIIESWDMKGELVNNITQATEFAGYLKEVEVFKGAVDFGFDKGFSIDNLVSIYSRGVLIWGGPLNLTTYYDDDDDDSLDEEERSEQDQADLKQYIVDGFLDEMDYIAEPGSNKNLNSYYFMGSLIFDVLVNIVIWDALLAIFSLVFVFFWLRINTGSFFLAGVGILEIFMSIPVAWFIFTGIFQIKYFAFLNALSIFIVAAIGADDIFIFIDAYKQSGERDPQNLENLETRMSWVYRRTGTAMAITSATTCSAFLCTLITPLVEIKSFGIFAAVVILIDYVLVMSLFCTAVVIYHDRYENRRAWCGCCTNCSYTDPSPTESAKAALELREDGEDIGKGDRVSKFFRNQVSGFIQVPWHRASLGVIFLVWIVVACWQTSKIEPTKETEQFLDEDHPLQKSFTILSNEFPTAEDDIGLKVYYAWGVGEVDRAGVNLLFDPENFGKPKFVETFDFNEQCQTELAKTCDKLRTDSDYEPYIKRKNGVGSVYCFIEEFAAYSVRGNLDDCEYVRQREWKNEAWQVPAGDVASVMEGFVELDSCYGDAPESISSRYSNELGWDGQAIRYAAIAVESEKLDPFSLNPQSYTRNEYDGFVSIAEELDAVVSQYCNGDVIMTDLDTIFVFMNNQAIYVRTAVQSSLLGVAIAFTVLLISTRVFHIALFASLSIVSVLLSVTGMMVMLGWYLGNIESILIGIIAGFSVDYVVHLAHAYETASGGTYERLTAAFGDMGISVLNGMVTSVAASIPLFFCQLQFFAKFGTFLCLTIAFSWIFANFGFMTVLAQLKLPIKQNKGCRF